MPFRYALTFLLLAACANAQPAPARSHSDPAIQAAARLVPGNLGQVEVVEKGGTSVAADGYVLRGDTTIYIVRGTPIYAMAAKQDMTGSLLLAAILVHEQAHVEGGDEAVAYRAQMEFLNRFRANPSMRGVIAQVAAIVAKRVPHQR